jgi:hypothetical protein
VLAKSKGVAGDCESEGSWRQIWEPTYRNCIQGGVMRVMLLNKQKPYYCTEHHHVNAEATSIESGLSYSGRSDTNLSEVRESAEEETTFKVQKAMSVW